MLLFRSFFWCRRDGSNSGRTSHGDCPARGRKEPRMGGLIYIYIYVNLLVYIYIRNPFFIYRCINIYIYIHISIYIYIVYIYIYIRFCCLAFVCGAFALRDKSYEDFRDTYEVSGPLFHMEVLRGPPRYLRGVRVFCLEVLRGLWRHLRGVSCVFLRGKTVFPRGKLERDGYTYEVYSHSGMSYEEIPG